VAFLQNLGKKTYKKDKEFEKQSKKDPEAKIVKGKVL
jgi:hypothetical protein